MKLTFRAAAGAADEGSGTRAIASVNVEQAKRMSQHKAPAVAASPAKSAAPAPAKGATPAPTADQAPAEKKKGCAAMIAFLIAAGALGAWALGSIVSALVLFISARG
jgi:hypothetical protein